MRLSYSKDTSEENTNHESLVKEKHGHYEVFGVDSVTFFVKELIKIEIHMKHFQKGE